ncbi:hypothetical protein BD413DRAFT_616876 [Trametes elegans]|nr:hypothetical protein BD413DRAFT_616876 [Trametes elegans]
MLRSLPSTLSVAGLLCLACWSELASAADTNVTWISPSDGDSYSSGDTVVGRWSADKAVVSPSFRICVTDDGGQLSSRSEDDGDGVDDGGDGDGHSSSNSSGGSAGSCGGTVWPTIQQSDGTYFVHLSLPNVTSATPCYLEMVDDFGAKMASPSFSFGGTPDDTDAAESADDPSSASPDTTSTATSATASISPPSTSTGPPMNTALPTQPQSFPQTLDESHIPVPTAAYAVPLSLVGSVILAAAGLAVHQRRKLNSEREREREHATLKSRGAGPNGSIGRGNGGGGAGGLSRHSTLSFAGFVNLGSGSHPHSRSTSVSMMRAWRRDVSQHHSHGNRPDAVSRASDDTTLAWHTDDAPSVSSSSRRTDREARKGHAAHGQGASRFTALPRRPTRDAFHAGAARPRRATATVPASVFRAIASPVFPHSPTEPSERARDTRPHKDRAYPPSGDAYYHDLERDTDAYAYDEAEEAEKPKGRGRTLVDPGVAEPRGTGGRIAFLNASATDSVVERYYLASPLARPERLHVRRHADADRDDPYRDSEAAPRDLYDAVARRISRGQDT